ncbi:MAG: hypothetical protein IK136_02390 [Oscillospiraceae bacterium]|nr:hypothetical protein [Oscillospiraceae bacterium]
MKKYTSRKFITAVAGIIAGVVVALGVDENFVTTVAGAVISAASLVTYIVTEGRLDEAAMERSREDERD